jgi:indolepyruvate ferredoxin oxidoreductase alpha subunit
MTMQKILMTGNEAIARGAYESGVTVAAGYPGTPSTEILENLVAYPEVYAEWAPNEKVALEVGFGASLAGARVLIAMKHVGLNVAADPFMTMSYTGTGGGLVLVTGDDPGMHSSQNEQDNRLYARFAKVPLMEPGDSQEAKEFIKEAFIISERYDTPVLFRITTRLAHTRTPVVLGDRSQFIPGEWQRNIPKLVMLPAYARQRHLVVEERRERLRAYAESSPLNEIVWGDREIGIISSGVAFSYAREAFGEGASYLKLGITNPLPLGLAKEFAGQVRRLIVVEELEPFLEEQLRAAGLKVEGKGLLPRVGELSPELIETGVRGRSRFRAVYQVPDNLPARPPIMCPGCPHRGVFYVLHKLRAVVAGDIGCYTLGAMPPFEAMDACLCMGAGIGASLGMQKAGGGEFARKVVAVIGDSTFIHSGITGLIDHIYNRSTGTIIILDNRTTAMTGHQDHPGTGRTLGGEETARIDFISLLRSLGVKNVRLVDPYQLRPLEEAIRQEMSREELSVVIASRPCVLIGSTPHPEGARAPTLAGAEAERRKTVAAYRERCTGCKKCLQLGCPAISLAGDRIQVDEDLCRGCTLCIQVCPQANEAGEEDE